MLADPRCKNVKDRVSEIKKRQKFRPFAPAILEEHFADYFKGYLNPYMQMTAQCKKPKEFPAIVHTDNSSRVQTVSEANSRGSGLRQILKAWYQETGCPMLLNTSLNVKDEPLVNTWKDAKKFGKMNKIRVF